MSDRDLSPRGLPPNMPEDALDWKAAWYALDQDNARLAAEVTRLTAERDEAREQAVRAQNDGADLAREWFDKAKAAEAALAKLSDPDAVHVNMLRGTIAKPSLAQIAHVYGDEWTAAPATARAEGLDCRQWWHYPIEIPLSADGQGPATVGVDAASVTYEVWDRLLHTHASFGNLPDAINEAMRLNALLPAPREGGEG